MRALKQIYILVLSFVFCALTVQAQSPKQDFRAVWFQTVWAGDWPKSYTQASQINEFQNHLKRFDDLKLNVACFQVRTMCDAFYQSSYEPWSVWMTGTRGKEPDYDPLAYLIKEAHARGIEVHAWINPYRFASSSTYSYSQGEKDYSITHPEWVKYCDAAGIYIINPSDPEVREQIVKVILDLIDHYDLDGVIFDDYFYQSGYKNEYDDSFYAVNNPQGLSRADWRRAQVNLMVKDVHDAIKSRHKWMRFGIGPAGVAASSKSVADKYGIEPCPSGSDWQYSGIYSEPVQWYVEHTIDYMAPQVYWPIGSTSNDYSKIVPWWYYVCHHFGRHCYISQSLSGLQPTILNKPQTVVKQSDFDAYEICRQLEINFVSTKENAPGMVFFNGSGFTKTNFRKVVTREEWTHRAKVPAMTWYDAPLQGVVSNIQRAGQKVSWTYSTDTVRYGIYAIPNAHRHDADVIASSRYYQGMAYAKSFTLPDSITAADYTIAVTVIDRYGNEWAPRFMGESAATTVTPTLLSPTNGERIVLPNYLVWKAVTGAAHYTVQVSDRQDMSHVLVQYQTDDTSVPTAMFADLLNKKTFYWRVSAEVENAGSKWSAIWRFTGDRLFEMIHPLNGDTAVSVTAEMSWQNIISGTTYVLEVASHNSFDESAIVYTTSTLATTAQIPVNTMGYNTTYYARVRALLDDELVTPVVTFRTQTTTFIRPTIISPANGSTLAYPTIHLVADVVPNNGYKFEISMDSSFSIRKSKIYRETTDMGVNYCDFAEMADGTYYAHAAVKAGPSGYTQFGETISFTYTRTTGVSDVHVVENSPPQKMLTRDGIRILWNKIWYDLRGNRVDEE